MHRGVVQGGARLSLQNSGKMLISKTKGLLRVKSCRLHPVPCEEGGGKQKRQQKRREDKKRQELSIWQDLSQTLISKGQAHLRAPGRHYRSRA